MSDRIEGRVKRISKPAESVYMIFADFSCFMKAIPADVIDKYELKFTSESITGRAYGFEMGIKIVERTPFSKVVYKQSEQTPVEFTLLTNITTLSPEMCNFQLIMETDLPPIYKMMLGNKLQEVVDKLTDNIEAAFNMGAGF